MARIATTRYRLREAPAELLLVQDLLNTRGLPEYEGADDLLDELDAAQAWLDEALGSWSEANGSPAPAIKLASGDLPKLRSLRSRFEELVDSRSTQLAPDAPAVPSGAVTVTIDTGGATRLTPNGSGLRWLTSALLLEMHEAQQADIWRRLKRCGNAVCGTAFYDRSKNNSGVWHDVATCGNAANLRAMRARRRSG